MHCTKAKSVVAVCFTTSC